MLLDEIRARPDDDAPRLVYADSLAHTDPLRGELIALQCAIARGELPRGDAVRARQRAATLLAEHGTRWAPLDGLANAWSFERGFVETATVDIRAFLARGGELVAAAPALRRLQIRGVTDELEGEAIIDSPSEAQYACVDQRLRALCTSPQLATITALGFSDATITYTYMGEMSMYDRSTSVHDRVVTELASSGVLRRLRGLALHRVEPDTATWLVRLADVAHLDDLELAGSFGNRFSFPADTPMRPRRLAIRDDRDLDLAILTNPVLTRVTELGDVPTAVPHASFVASAPIPTELTRRLRALRITAGYPKSITALAELELSELRDLAIDFMRRTSSHRAIDTEHLVPLLDLELPNLRVLRLEGLRVDADFARSIYGSPLVRTCEMIDFTRSELVDVPDAFGVVILR